MFGMIAKTTATAYFRGTAWNACAPMSRPDVEEERHDRRHRDQRAEEGEHACPGPAGTDLPDVSRVLTRIHGLGLAAPDQPAAGLGADFMLTTGGVPKAAEPPEPSRDMPPEIICLLSARLDDLDRGPCGPEIRTGIVLMMDTGRVS